MKIELWQLLLGIPAVVGILKAMDWLSDKARVWFKEKETAATLPALKLQLDELQARVTEQIAGLKESDLRSSRQYEGIADNLHSLAATVGNVEGSINKNSEKLAVVANDVSWLKKRANGVKE